MRKALRSLGFATTGLLHAIQRERNLRFFMAGACTVMFIATIVDISVIERLMLFVAMGMFVSVELLNTALERLTDAYDECRMTHDKTHHHPHLKATKDVAAAASLVSLIMTGIVTIAILVPHVRSWLGI